MKLLKAILLLTFIVYTFNKFHHKKFMTNLRKAHIPNHFQMERYPDNMTRAYVHGDPYVLQHQAVNYKFYNKNSILGTRDLWTDCL